MRRLAAQLGLLVFLAQAASAGYIAGRIVDIRGADRGEIVRVDWQYPWQLASALSQSLRLRTFHGASLLFQSLRQRLSILLLLRRFVRLLSPRPRLLRLERHVTLPSVAGAKRRRKSGGRLRFDRG